MNDRKTNEPLFYFDEGLRGIYDYKPREWIIPNLIPQGANLSGVVGESGSGKSCFVYDILMNYLTGATEWFNFPMRGDNRNCVLLTSEGDYKRRLLGWLYNRGMNNFEEAHTEGRLLILDPSKCSDGISITARHTAPLIESIKDKVPSVGLIVIDTLNGFYGNGSENDNSDMSVFLGNINQISQEFDASTIIIHHKGKGESADAKGRGASSFNAKLDMNISVEGKPLTGMTISTTKARDSIEGLYFNGKSKVVPIAYRPDGTTETTIVMDSFEQTVKPIKPKNKYIELIQEGITAGLIHVEANGFITRENLTTYFKTHGNGEKGGFQGKSGAINQSNPNYPGICQKLMNDNALEWIEGSNGYLLRDTDSYCWK